MRFFAESFITGSSKGNLCKPREPLEEERERWVRERGLEPEHERELGELALQHAVGLEKWPQTTQMLGVNIENQPGLQSVKRNGSGYPIQHESANPVATDPAEMKSETAAARKVLMAAAR